MLFLVISSESSIAQMGCLSYLGMVDRAAFKNIGGQRHATLQILGYTDSVNAAY